MSDETYNGWRNYPTWCVNLWLGNDSGSYDAAVEITQETILNAEDCEQVESGVWTLEQARRFMVADALKAWVCDDLAPDLGATFGADLLGYALSLVDWDEIADHWVADALEARELA